MSEPFNLLASMLASLGDTDAVVSTLHAARTCLLKACRETAEEALLCADRAMQDALDEELSSLVFHAITEARLKQEAAREMMQQVLALTTLIHNAQETGDEEDDEAMRYADEQALRTEVIAAILEGADTRIDSALDQLPDSTAPGARCKVPDSYMPYDQDPGDEESEP